MGNPKKNPIYELWETLLNPDREDAAMKDKVIVIQAANQLQVGEFQLLQLAYREWHAEDLPETLIAKLFTDYMLKDEVPHWARHYAKRVLAACEKGEINENAPDFHRYDHDYGTIEPHAVRRFCVAVGCLVVFLGGGIVLANITAGKSASMFPPYLDVNDLPRKTPAGRGP